MIEHNSKEAIPIYRAGLDFVDSLRVLVYNDIISCDECLMMLDVVNLAVLNGMKAKKEGQ